MTLSFLAWVLLIFIAVLISSFADLGNFATEFVSGIWWAVAGTVILWLLTLPAVIFFSRKILLLAGLVLPAPLAATTFLLATSNHRRIVWDLYETSPIWSAALVSCVYAGVYVAFVDRYRRRGASLERTSFGH